MAARWLPHTWDADPAGLLA